MCLSRVNSIQELEGLYKNLKSKTASGTAKELLGEVGRLYLHQMWHILESGKSPEGDFPENAPLTEYLKGFNHPLIDTGTLFQSLRYKVKTK